MRPIVNMSEEDRATDTGNMHKNLVKIARVHGSGDILAGGQTDRQTDPQTYILITILYNRSHGRRNKETKNHELNNAVVLNTRLEFEHVN